MNTLNDNIHNSSDYFSYNNSHYRPLLNNNRLSHNPKTPPAQ